MDINNTSNNIQTAVLLPKQNNHANRQSSKESSQTKKLEHDINPKEVKVAVDKVNSFLDFERTNLKFIFHEDLHEYYVAVVNPITNETIKEIPPKKMLDFHAGMKELIGVLLDEKA